MIAYTSKTIGAPLKLIDNKIWFSPTDLSQFYASPFASWMTRFQLENPAEKFEFAEDPTMTLLAKRGVEHELRYLAQLRTENKQIVEIERSDFKTASENTLKAMGSGAQVIYQGAFVSETFRGFSDFLVRVDKPSKLGNFSYEVWDTKLALTPKPEYILQLSCYSDMLADIQGIWPEKISLVLGDNSKVDFRIDDYKAYYQKFKKDFLKYHVNWDSKKRPMPQVWESLGDWEDIGKEMLKGVDHLSLVAGMGQVQIKKLESAGIVTAAQLANAKKSQRPEKMQETTFHRLNRQAYLQQQTEKLGVTQFELRKLETTQAFGLERLPPEQSDDVYFDMEGFPLAEDGLEYLFGAVVEEKKQLVFKDWWALDKLDEKKAFEDFIDWVFARYKKNPTLHIYHYAAYEVSAMKNLVDQHLTRGYEVDELLRNNVFVDLYQVVREGLIVGESSYSIKKLESLYGFKRAADVKNAGDSVVQFAKWLEIKDGADHNSSAILKQIRDYNEEDCFSTIQLTKWLRAVQQKNGISYSKTTEATYVATEKTESDKLEEKLSEIILTQKTDAELHRLLTTALGYHRREAKPQWWAFFDRIQKLPEDLYNDMECLASCQFLKKVEKKVSIKFDPEQETKITINSKLCLHGNTKIKATVEEIDYNSGKALLHIASKLDLPDEITLMPEGPISTAVIENSIYETSNEWSKHKDATKMQPALFDLLTRAKPRFKDKRTLVHRRIVSDPEFLAEVIDSCKNLDSSLLAIQGPPGTGKTYTASHLIAELLIAKKKIGIVSNSHKAINLLMQKSHDVLTERKLRSKFIFYKAKADKEEEFLASAATLHAKSVKDFFADSDRQFNLVGGTAWFFSAEDAKNQFDYLFVEEAGQFSLANTIASLRAAKNLVLLGDQMQLEQPMQGTHPGEIAESALGHYLKGMAAVPPEMGVFLGQSRRMHPDVCSFISEMIYESKLDSHVSAHGNKVEIAGSDIITKNTGLIYVPVKHEGNSQGSDEEVQVIQKIIKDLSKSILHQQGGKANFNLKNCLFVAPYNLQVGKLKAVLGDLAKVGSVDLFQGQEADIVILSMCSSDGEVSPRGLEFLLNKNRMNVAISRAKTLAIVVGSEQLVESRAKTIKNMALLNLFCRVIEVG